MALFNYDELYMNDNGEQVRIRVVTTGLGHLPSDGHSKQVRSERRPGGMVMSPVPEQREVGIRVVTIMLACTDELR